MNTVDSLVKRTILNYPICYPTRLHVLEHCLLGNGTGYGWSEKEDGFWYLEAYMTRREEPYSTTIEMNKPCDYEEGLSLDAQLDNHFRQWVNDNIDEYCKASYFHNYTSRLLPLARYGLVTPNFNRLDEIPDMSKIAPEWRGAIKEVCEHFMTDIAQMYAGSPYLDCLPMIKCKMFAEYYCLLQTQWKRILDLPEEKKSRDFMINLTDKLLREMG